MQLGAVNERLGCNSHGPTSPKGLDIHVRSLAELCRLPIVVPQHAANHVVLLHIGSETPFTKGIKDLGCPVHLVAKAEDLVGLCLDLAKNTYDTDNRSLRRSNPAARRIRR